MIRKARAVWRGTGKDGKGELTTDSGVLSSTPYSFKTRFESEKGTNPEELMAAAHAGCFTMALAFQLQGAGVTPTELETEAAVSLDKDGEGFTITKSTLTLRAEVPGIERGKSRGSARAAGKNARGPNSRGCRGRSSRSSPGRPRRTARCRSCSGPRSRSTGRWRSS